MDKDSFHTRLKSLIDQYVHLVYDVTRNFPKNETYGIISQYRRAAISIMLNYIEGYARRRKAVLKNFLEIALGSFKESEYLTEFCYKQKYINDKDYQILTKLEIEIGKMLWGTIVKL